jgi:hypothetical protein
MAEFAAIVFSESWELRIKMRVLEKGGGMSVCPLTP